MKKAPLSQQHVQDAEQVVVMDSNKDLREVRAGKDERGKKSFFSLSRRFYCHLLIYAIAVAHCVNMSRRPGWFGIFFSATHPTPKFFLFVALHQAQDLRL